MLGLLGVSRGLWGLWWPLRVVVVIVGLGVGVGVRWVVEVEVGFKMMGDRV